MSGDLPPLDDRVKRDKREVCHSLYTVGARFVAWICISVHMYYFKFWYSEFLLAGEI